MNDITPPIYRATISVHGRVQGVGFRYWVAAELKSRKLPICGTVRNQPDGTVEVLAESNDHGALDQLIQLLARGPAHAHVKSVNTLYETDDKTRFDGFSIQY